MKKLIASILFTLVSFNASAANTSDVIGGVIGGIVIGKVLTDSEYRNRQPAPAQGPVYVPAPQYPMCPHPYSPVYDWVWIIDQYNRNIQVQRFIGCR